MYMYIYIYIYSSAARHDTKSAEARSRIWCPSFDAMAANHTTKRSSTCVQSRL